MSTRQRLTAGPLPFKTIKNEVDRERTVMTNTDKTTDPFLEFSPTILSVGVKPTCCSQWPRPIARITPDISRRWISIGCIKADLCDWKDYPLNIDAATEDHLRRMTPTKSRKTTCVGSLSLTTNGYEDRRIDLYEHGDGVRETEIEMLVDEILQTANEKDNFDLDVDVTFFLDERGYQVTERLIDEVRSRAWKRIEENEATRAEISDDKVPHSGPR